MVYVGDDRLLHCYDLDHSNPPGCDGAALGPPAPLDEIDDTTLTVDDSGRVYVTRGLSIVLRYTP